MRTNPDFIKSTAQATSLALQHINDLMDQAEQSGQGVPLTSLVILTSTQSMLTEMCRQTAMLNIIARALVGDDTDKALILEELLTFTEVI